MTRKYLLFAGCLLLGVGAMSLSVVGIRKGNDGVFICEDTGQEGPMFYAASYGTDISNEPKYSTQNTYTFEPLNLGNVPSKYRGDSVKVAVIDSGLNYDHEDFAIGGTKIIQGNSRAIDNSSGTWLYYQYSSGYQSKLNDSFGHGTNVASVIASQINSVGCAGIAPNVDLYIYKVTNENKGYEWTAINSALQYCIDEGIDVINMSFQAYEHAVSYGTSSMAASSGCSTALSTMINKCYNAGITLVGAAGNYNTSEPSYPASNSHVISVGSLAESSKTEKAGYSNYGTTVDLVAPGTVYVANAGSNNAYKETSGTSFSAPIVTAAIALYKQKYSNATPSQIEAALYNACEPISGDTTNWSGHGRLNLAKFLGEDVDPYAEYYKNVDTSSMSNIQSTLHTTISKNTTDVGYDGLFNAYKTTDVKPNTNYFWDMYSNENYTTNDKRINAQYSEEGDSINREHTIPQSWFNEASPMKADLFHVYPTDGYVNNRRSNYPHGDVTSATYTSKNGSKLGTGNNTAVNNLLGNDKKLFEVIDEYKGDFARSYFYFATRYSDKISSFTTDGKRLFTTTAPYMQSAFIDMYYTWHINDPVSQKEIDRNNAVYAIQNNRNPYIDHPEWVAIAFNKGTAVKTLSSIAVSGQKTEYIVGDTFVKPTVTATYSDNTTSNVTNNATFSGYDLSTAGNQTVDVSYTEGSVTKTTSYDITVSSPTPSTKIWSKITSTSELTSGDYLIVNEGDSVAFNGGLSSLDANNNNISVSISNEKINYSTETNNARFTISSMEGGYSVKATNGNYISGGTSNCLNLSKDAKANTISFSNGNAAIKNGSTTLLFNNAKDVKRFRYYTSNQQPIQLYKLSGGDAPTPTITKVTVSPSTLSLDVNGTKTGTLTATVEGTGSFSKNVTWKSSNESVATVSSKGVVTAKSQGNAVITATSTDDLTKSGTCDVTVTAVVPVTLSSIAVSGQKTEYILGSTFVKPTVTATYSDDSTKDVTNDTEFNGYNLSQEGTQTVIATYIEDSVTATTSYTIKVSKNSGIKTVTLTAGAEGCTGTSGGVGPFSYSMAKGNSQNDPFYSSSAVEWRMYYATDGNGNTCTVSFSGISVTSFTITASSDSGNPNVSYKVDKGSYSSASWMHDGTLTVVKTAYNSFTFKNANTTSVQLKIKSISINYMELAGNKVINSLSASYVGDNLHIGDELVKSNVKVIASFTDSTYQDEQILANDFSLSGFDSSTAGTKTVTVTYIGTYKTYVTPMTTTFTVNVLNPLTDFRLESPTKSVSFGSGVNKLHRIDLYLYEYVDGIKNPNYIAHGEDYIDTSSLGVKKASLEYQSVTYYCDVLVTNNGSKQEDVKKNYYSEFDDKYFDANTKTAQVGELNLTLDDNGGYYGYDATKGQQVGSGNKPATSMTLSTTMSGTITSVKVSTSGGSGTNATLCVSVGGKAFEYKNTANSAYSAANEPVTEVAISTTNTEYEFVGSSEGEVVITWTQTSSKALYIKNVQVLADKGISFTSLEQAQSWASYFIEKTRTMETCLASDDATKLAGLKAVWSNLSIEYSNMIGDAKDIFCSSDDPLVMEARQHYLFIISKFNKSGTELDPFVKDSSGDTPSQATPSNLMNVNTNTIIIATVCIVSISAVAIYLFNKKKSEINR